MAQIFSQAYAPRVLRELNALPFDALSPLINEDLCRAVYGVGSTDLTGQGVLVSFCIQVALAAISWICGFVDCTILPTLFRNRYSPRRVSGWLADKHHQACLWSQLAFTIALCIAGLVRHMQRKEWIGTYESVAIIASTTVSGCALVLTTLSYNINSARNDRPQQTFGEKGEKKVLFALSYAVALITWLLAVISPLWIARLDNLLQLCHEYASEENKPWRDGAVLPIPSDQAGYIARTVITSVAVLAGLACWYLLRNRSFAQSGIMRATLLSTALMVSGFLVYMCGVSLWSLVATRNTINILWGGQNEQDVWTIGQVGAVFSWAPLLADTACLGIPVLFSHSRRQP